MLKMDLVPYLLKVESKKVTPSEKSLIEIQVTTFLFKELFHLYKCRNVTYLNLIKSKSLDDLYMMQVNLIK